jgi:integrase/recombinase XerD
MKTEYGSTIGPVIRRYVTLKRSLGFNFHKQSSILLSLDQFLTNRKKGFRDLTGDAFLEWCKGLAKLTSGELQRRMQVVRSFCLYRRRIEPDCFVPDKSTFPACHQPVRPYIFSVAEIARLLEQCHCLTRHPHSPLRPELFRLIVVLLFTTGLRHGELLRLTVADYDPIDGTLLIRESKFHKSRLVALREDICNEVDHYLEIRRRWRLPVTPETPLVWNRSRLERAYSHCGVWLNVRLLLKMANIQKPDGRLPRVHDFRHSFAVNVLLRWYRSGVDVQSKLPYLSAYMGHVSIESTYYYLHFVEPLTSLASIRFANLYGALVSAPAKRKGGSR